MSDLFYFLVHLSVPRSDHGKLEKGKIGRTVAPDQPFLFRGC